MKRLSVRLSIVGAILALGAAAIAHSLLSDGEPAPSGKTDDATDQKMAELDPTKKSLSPIRSGDDDVPDDPNAQPSFAPPPDPGARFVQPVSHEQSPAAGDGSETSFPTAQSSQSGFPSSSGFPPTPPAYGGAAEDGSAPKQPGLPPIERVTGSVSDDSPDTGAVPAGYDASDGLPTGDEPNDGNANPPPPSTGFPMGESVTPDTNATQSTNDSALPRDPTQPVPIAPTVNPYAGDPITDVGDNAKGSSGIGVPVAAGAAVVAGGGLATQPHELPGSGLIPNGPAADGVNQGQPTYGSPTQNTASNEPADGGGYPGTSSDSTGQSMIPSTPSIGTQSFPNRSMTDAAGSGTVTPTTDGVRYGAPMSNLQAGAVAAAMTSDVPGDRKLEGQQTPAIALEKLAPDEIQVDREATFQIRVRNVGNATAHQVVVVDQVPRGTEFIDATPQCTRTPDGMLIWKLETVEPSEETVISIKLLPKVAGEVGSVAQATFQAQASIRTICTKPQLAVELTAPEKVLIGQSATLELTVTNTGTGAATNVVIEEDVPDGFAHAAGRELEHEVGTLRPQESRRLTLALEAVKPGVYENRLTVRGDANLSDIDVRKIEIVAPELAVEIKGPTRRYLDRQATYTISLVNPGTAAARNVELAAYLPKGMKYVTSDNQGQYDTQSHAVYWSLEELPDNRQGDVHVTVLPLEPGNLKLKTTAQADLELTAAHEHQVTVEGLAELNFTIADIADPIEVGSETTYEIAVQNRGSQADTDVQLVAELPPGLAPVNGEGPTQGTVRGQQVVFDPLARLAPGDEAVYKITATGQAIGDHIIRAQLQSKELRVPVTKEESTRVYSDR